MDSILRQYLECHSILGVLLCSQHYVPGGLFGGFGIERRLGSGKGVPPLVSTNWLNICPPSHSPNYDSTVADNNLECRLVLAVEYPEDYQLD